MSALYYASVLDRIRSPDVFKVGVYLFCCAFNSPTHRVRCNGNRISVVESQHWTAELIRFPRVNLKKVPTWVNPRRQTTAQSHRRAHPPYCVSFPEPPDVPLAGLSDERIIEADTNAQALSRPQDPLWGGNTSPWSVAKRRGKSRNKGSGFCRPPASVFHLGRLQVDCGLCSGAWFGRGSVRSVVCRWGTERKTRGKTRIDRANWYDGGGSGTACVNVVPLLNKYPSGHRQLGQPHFCAEPLTT